MSDTYEHEGLEQKFGKYTAEMCSFEKGHVDCHIEGPRGETGSLALALGTGRLTGRSGDAEDIPIPATIVAQIEKWALARGY